MAIAASFASSPSLAILDMLGGSELLVIFLLVLVFFGGEKMPEVARGLAKAIREFKKAASGVEEEFKRAIEEDPPRRTPPPPATVPADVPGTPSILPPKPTEPAAPSADTHTPLPTLPQAEPSDVAASGTHVEPSKPESPPAPPDHHAG